MSWELGYDKKWSRDIGYGVPAVCDHPDCNVEIDRGLSYVCADGKPYGGDRGCGLYFCGEHQHLTEKHHQLCIRCLRGNRPFNPKPETNEWLHWKLTDESWAEWRADNQDEVQRIKAAIAAEGEK